MVLDDAMDHKDEESDTSLRICKGQLDLQCGMNITASQKALSVLRLHAGFFSSFYLRLFGICMFPALCVLYVLYHACKSKLQCSLTASHILVTKINSLT